MIYVTVRLIVLLTVFISVACLKKIQYQWENTGLWTSCSETCGIGVQYNSLFCAKTTVIGTLEKVTKEHCKNVNKPMERVVRTCFYGNCANNESNEYIWKVGKWTSCSTSCGGDGVQTREVQCVLIFSSGNYIEAKEQNCKSESEPIKSQKCGSSDCPPEFFKTSWDKCSKMNNCNPGIKRRKINCMVTLRNGTSKPVKPWNCYARSKPPKTWEKCLNDPEYLTKCKFKNKAPVKKLPIIGISKSKIHQMRHNKKLKLQIGQTVYVFPHTRLIINCPVQNYAITNLQWLRFNVTYRHVSQLKSRIFVNAKGQLIIKNFLSSDEGDWICKADDVSQKITLKIRNPSEGYADWLARNIYLKQDIILIKNNSIIKYVKSVFYQWVVGSWTSCSKTCGIGGFQYRQVSCERIESRFFEEVDDKLCKKESFKKPENKRNCSIFPSCPTWSLSDLNTVKCTNTCVDIGIARRDIKVICKYENRILPPNNCDSKTIPIQTCSNAKCVVYWAKSNWSACSSSCGKSGLSMRSAKCLWKHDGSSGGNLCNKIMLQLPDTIRRCHPPPCNLACIDLLKYCGSKNLCHIDHYQYFCCKTCSAR